MAIYHLHVSVGNKAKGASAALKAEYIQRIGAFERDAQEVAFSQTRNLPDWADSPEEFWRSVDTHERANGVVYREVEVSLPRELEPAQQRELAETFAQDLTRAELLPYTMAIHKGAGENPHAHIMICERANDGIARDERTWFKRANTKEPEKGGAAKVREMRSKTWLMDTRASWAASTNRALERAGVEQKIDHRSYKDQGIALTPQIHLGPEVAAMRARGIETERSRLYDQIQALRREQERVLETTQKAAFLERAHEHHQVLEREHNVIPEDGRLEGTIERVNSSPNGTFVMVVEDPVPSGQKPQRALLLEPGISIYDVEGSRLVRGDLPDGLKIPEVGERVSVRGATLGYGRDQALEQLQPSRPGPRPAHSDRGVPAQEQPSQGRRDAPEMPSQTQEDPEQEMRLAREFKLQRQRDRLMMMKQGLTRRTLEPGESFKGVVEKVVQRGQSSYAILVEHDARGTPTSFVVLDQPQAVRASASLDKDDPKIEYARQPVLELRQGERVEVRGEQVLSNGPQAKRTLDNFKLELRREDRAQQREQNPSRGKDGPDWER